jgi:HAD superfamily hydrolase (TIGR01549 family)
MEGAMRIRAVFFDFDGTIDDSSSLKMGGKRIVKIVRRNGYKIPRGIYEILKSKWGLDGKSLIGACFGLDSEMAERIYREWEKTDASKFFPLIPGSKRVLKKLKSEGIKVFLLTSRNRENLMVVLNHFGLVELFDLIQAKDNYVFTKPDSRAFYPLLVELSKSGICPKECIYVGDTTFDFKCATGAGVRSISVLTGPFDESDFLKAGQKKENIIRSIADLPEWIERHKDC